MITQSNFDLLRIELSVKAKNGLNFIAAASLVWLIISFVWTLNYSAYNKSVLTFCVGALMLPLALLFSKIFKTTWTLKNNPLDPLGLWLNFAQLFYFPFLIFVLLKMPEYFVMTYAIITGAHFFPYSWFYKNKLYALAAGVISIGSFFLGFYLPTEKIYFVPLYMSLILLILSVFLFFDFKKKASYYQGQ
ncbi:MAG: hypothetical protein E6Q41_01585 [Cyclobacteriaceae bacterium]|nr:MAG: hypothetical protein E6Q41_01585 [Cyclobacteriaceae bacterium]